MKFKKLVAAFSAVTMLGSLAVAVPANAEEDKNLVVSYDGSQDINFESRETAGTYASGSAADNDAQKWYVKDPTVSNTDDGTGSYKIDGIGGTKDKEGAGNLIRAVKLVIPVEENTEYTISFARKWDFDSLADINNGLYWGVEAYDANNKRVGPTPDDTGALLSQQNRTKDTQNHDWEIVNRTVTTPANTKSLWILFYMRSVSEGSAWLDDIKLYKPVAKINDKGYLTFAEAVDAANNGDTIDLLDNVTTGRIIFDSSHYNKSNITINGNGYSINSDNKDNCLFEVKDKILNLNNVSISGGKEFTLNIKGSSTINLDNVTVSANAMYINSSTAQVTATGLVVTDAKDGTIIVTANSNFDAAISISLGTPTANDYDYDSSTGKLKAKSVEPTTENEYFMFTSDEADASYSTVAVKATKGSETDEKTANLPTTITGSGSLYLCIEGVPTDVKINSVTLK